MVLGDACLEALCDVNWIMDRYLAATGSLTASRVDVTLSKHATLVGHA